MYFSLRFFCIGVLGTTSVQAQLQWGKVGVMGGAGLERVDDLASPGVTAAFESPFDKRYLGGAAGYQFGVSYDQPLGAVSVRPALVVRRAGSFQFPSSFEGTSHSLLEGQSFDVWVFEIPVDVRYQYDFTEAAALYGFGGPVLSIPRAEADFDQSFRTAAFAVQGGIGGEFDVPGVPLILAPEFSYSYSVTNTVKKDFQLRGRTFDTEGLSFSGPSVRLHVYYPLDF